MRKTVSGVVAAVSIGFGLACSGMNLPMGTPGGGGSGNVDACKKYVQAMNDAACNPMDLDASQICPDSLNLTPCSMASYYDCMAGAVKCNGDVLDISGQANCAPTTCN